MEHEQRFPRDVAALEAIYTFVCDFFSASGLDHEDTSTVQLFIEEIFTNMVKYSKDGKEDIAIRLRRKGDVVEIRLVDFDVQPFDYARAPAVEPEQLLAQKRAGGLGLHLVRTMADRFAYEYTNGNSTVTIEKRLGG